MSDMPVTPPPPQGPWAPDPGRRARGSRMLKVAVGVGAAAGVAVGATALAQAATSSSGPPQSAAAAVTASGSTTTTLPSRSHGFAGPGGRLRGPGGFGGLGPLGGPGVLGGGLGAGSLIDGQFTLKGPNGYETIAERSGTVSDVTDTSGSTWTLTVKSADGSSGTFTVDTGTSVNGGETGIGSVKTGDTVSVIAVVSGGTATAKQVTDETVLKANGATWQPMRPSMGSPGSTGTTGNGSASTSAQTDAPPV